MARVVTEHGLCAKAIRNEIKKMFNLKSLTNFCKVNSKSYSGGSSIRINLLTSVCQEDLLKLKSLGDKYTYGNFDPMTDYFNYDVDDSIPQVKYVFVNKLRNW